MASIPTPAKRLNNSYKKIPQRLLRTEGLTNEIIESLRNTFNECIQVLNNIESVGISNWKVIVEDRYQICKSCEKLKKDTCIEIKTSHGCSSCTQPWKIRNVQCPLKKWKDQ